MYINIYAIYIYIYIYIYIHVKYNLCMACTNIKIHV